jgi:osmotically-inducible protein OsmY
MLKRRYVTYFFSFLMAAFLTGCAGSSTQESTGEYIDDTVITARVQKVLIEDDTVKLRDLNIDTFKGTVQISGFVDNQEQLNRALELARSQKGVKAVVNKMQIKPGASS